MEKPSIIQAFRITASRTKLWIVWHFLCCLLPSALYAAQASDAGCPVSADIHVVSLEYVSMTDQATGKFFWQLDLLKDADGILDEEALTKAIQTADNDIRSSVATTVSSLDESSLGDVTASLFGNIEHLDRPILIERSRTRCRVRLPDGSENVFPAEPAAPGPAQSGVTQEGVRAQIALEFETARPVVQQIEIEVTTQRASRNLQQALTTQRTLGEVNAEQGNAALDLSAEARSILVTLRYASDDMQGDEQGLRVALGRAGWLLYHTARENCMGVDLSEPSEATRGVIIEKAEEGLALPDGQRSSRVFVLPEQTDVQGHFRYKLGITDLRLVSDVKVVSLPYPWEDDEFRKREGQAAELIAGKRVARLEEIAKLYQEEVATLRKIRVLTAADLETLRVKLRADRDVLSIRQPETMDNGDDYAVTLPVIIRDPPVLTVSAGGSYSAENGATADATVIGANYLHQRASFSANLKLGNHVQRGNVTGQIEQPIDGHVHAIYGLEGRIFRNTKQILDEEQFDSVEERESGIRPKIGMRYDSSSVVEYRPDLTASSVSSSVSRVRGALDVAFDYRDIDLKARGLDNTTLSGGTLAALSLAGTLFFTNAPGDGRNTFFKYSEAALAATSERGLNALGGHFTYEQYHVVASLTLFMGFSANRNDLFARYRQGFGVSSRDTPIFKQFRLGGFETLPGLQNGEVLANNYGFRQIELGISLVRLIPGGQNNTGIIPPNVFLKLSYASACTATAHEWSQLLHAGPGLEGYGIGLEFRSDDQMKALTVGYAYSPDSQRHPSGMFVTGVLIFF